LISHHGVGIAFVAPPEGSVTPKAHLSTPVVSEQDSSHHHDEDDSQLESSYSSSTTAPVVAERPAASSDHDVDDRGDDGGCYVPPSLGDLGLASELVNASSSSPSLSELQQAESNAGHQSNDLIADPTNAKNSDATTEEPLAALLRPTLPSASAIRDRRTRVLEQQRMLRQQIDQVRLGWILLRLSSERNELTDIAPRNEL